MARRSLDNSESLKWMIQELDALKRQNSALEQENQALKEIKKEVDQLRIKSLSYKALAYRDEVTGLWNRRYFNERIEEEMHRVHRHPERELSILVIDINNFKDINDTFGHDTGDQVLRWIADLLQSHLRGCDICCRWGGDEFAVILPDTNTFGINRVIERLKEACAKRQFTMNLPKITISVGAATWPHSGASIQKLLKTADAAMYHDKYQQKAQALGMYEKPTTSTSSHLGQ